MNITVNGETIAQSAIDAEVQYHPAADLEAARKAAAEALVIRALLRQAAGRMGLKPDDAPNEEDAPERGEEERLIAALLELVIIVPEADDSVCRRYYERNPRKFRSRDLFEAAHILFPAAPHDETARARAKAAAEATIAELTAAPERFGELARARSACSSKIQDGRLGQVSRGDTVPEFETFLCNLEEGQLCPVPVMTRYGAHVLRLDRRICGRELPFEIAKPRIADYLHERAWRRAVHQYLQLLIGGAEITGVTLSGATTPLVQ